jgi:hypothetical protein
MFEPADADGLACPLAAAVGAAIVALDPALLAAGVADPQAVMRTGARQSIRARLRRNDRRRPPAFPESLRPP